MTLEELLVIIGLFAIAGSILYYAENETLPEINMTPNITIEPATITPIEKQAIIITLPTVQVTEIDPLEVGNWVQKQDSCLLYTSPSPRDS